MPLVEYLIISGLLIYLILYIVDSKVNRRYKRRRRRRFNRLSLVSLEVRSAAHSLVADKTALTRLLNGYRMKYPGRSEQWLWEKMVWDLERDRYR